MYSLFVRLCDGYFVQSLVGVQFVRKTESLELDLVDVVEDGLVHGGELEGLLREGGVEVAHVQGGSLKPK